MTPKIVEVTWRDACVRLRGGPLASAKDAGQLSERRTVGYLVHRSREKLVLAWTFDAAEDASGEHAIDDVYTIPAGWVKRVRVLR